MKGRCWLDLMMGPKPIPIETHIGRDDPSTMGINTDYATNDRTSVYKNDAFAMADGSPHARRILVFDHRRDSDNISLLSLYFVLLRSRTDDC